MPAPLRPPGTRPSAGKSSPMRSGHAVDPRSRPPNEPSPILPDQRVRIVFLPPARSPLRDPRRHLSNGKPAAVALEDPPPDPLVIEPAHQPTPVLLAAARQNVKHHQ